MEQGIGILNPVTSVLLEGAIPGILVISLFLVLLPWIKPDSQWRIVLTLAALALTARYVYWRLTATIPPASDTLDFTFGVLFFVVEATAIAGSVMTFITMSRTCDRTSEVEANWHWLFNRAELPLVDVFICTYNEEREILERTMIGAKAMDYPNFRVWVLDDGRRQWLAELSDLLGCHYLTRPDNAHAKAGNINNALAHVRGLPRSPGFISVLDADFVPAPNFLSRAMTLFHEGDVGIVQTPQHFTNPDPIQKNLDAVDIWPDEQRFFFDIIMPSKDAWGTAFCCGTSSVIRMSALERVGGVPTSSVTEDYLLTLRLKRFGYRTVYLNERLSLGLAPEGLREYITQRSRWCLGLVQILRSGDGPFKAGNGLPVIDRIGLVESFLYWTGTYSFRLSAFVVPVLFFLFGIRALNVDLVDGISHFLPYFAAHVAVIGWLSGWRVLPILTDLSHLLAAREIVSALFMGLFKPHGHRFKVTAKGGDRSKLIIHWRSIALFGSLLVLTLAGLGYAFGIDPDRYLDDSSIIALVWSWYNIMVLIAAIACCIERPARRKSDRLNASHEIEVVTGGLVRKFSMIDISVSGIRLRGNPGVPIGSGIAVRMGGVDLPGRIIRQTRNEFGIEIEHSFASRIAMIQQVYSGKFGSIIENVKTGLVARRMLRRLFN